MVPPYTIITRAHNLLKVALKAFHVDGHSSIGSSEFFFFLIKKKFRWVESKAYQGQHLKAQWANKCTYKLPTNNVLISTTTIKSTHFGIWDGFLSIGSTFVGLIAMRWEWSLAFVLLTIRLVLTLMKVLWWILVLQVMVAYCETHLVIGFKDLLVDIGRSGHSQGRIDGDSGRPEVGMGDAFRWYYLYLWLVKCCHVLSSCGRVLEGGIVTQPYIVESIRNFVRED